MPSVPDIKLTRTDTTHDLSQKAEKRCRQQCAPWQTYMIQQNLSKTFHVGVALSTVFVLFTFSMCMITAVFTENTRSKQNATNYTMGLRRVFQS